MCLLSLKSRSCVFCSTLSTELVHMFTPHVFFFGIYMPLWHSCQGQAVQVDARLIKPFNNQAYWDHKMRPCWLLCPLVQLRTT